MKFPKSFKIGFETIDIEILPTHLAYDICREEGSFHANLRKIFIAIAFPVIIPAIDKGRVLNLAAVSQTKKEAFKRLWELSVLFEIWVSFIQKSLLTFLGLIHEIIHQGGIASQLHQPVLSV